MEDELIITVRIGQSADFPVEALRAGDVVEVAGEACEVRGHEETLNDAGLKRTLHLTPYQPPFAEV